MSKLIILAGGGTLGPVAPLLAVVSAARATGKNWDFIWVGTINGSEQQLVKALGLPFYSITSGKWHRFVTWKNLLAPLSVFLGFFQSLSVLLRLQPVVVLTAGGFVCVPLAWAAWCLRIPVAIHQQDADWGLANRFMLPIASLCTAVFSQDRSRAKVIGNLIRPAIYNGQRERGLKICGFSGERPVILIMGGGTGAQAINHFVAASYQQLSAAADIIHLSGVGKAISVANSPHYFQLEFSSTQLPDLFALADIVVCRGGMSTLSELAVLSKPVIIIPIPASHQEQNTKKMIQGKAAVVLSQTGLSPQIFSHEIISLLNNKIKRLDIGHALHELIGDGTTAYLKLVTQLIE